MAKIRVDPAILISNSSTISTTAANVSTTGQSALNAAQTAPSYNGQFGPRVKAIGAEAMSRAQCTTGRLNNSAFSLNTRANAFLNADTTYTKVSIDWKLINISRLSEPLVLPDYLQRYQNPNLVMIKPLRDGEYNWGKWSFSAIELSKETIKNIGEIPFNSINKFDFHDIGTLLNKISGLLGGSHTGWISRMDKIGHLLKGPLKKALPIIGIIIGIISDRRQGKPWDISVGSEVIEAGLNLAPPIAIYNLILALGMFGSGLFEITGHDEEAEFTQKWADKLDLTEKFGDSFVDFLKNNPDCAGKLIMGPMGAAMLSTDPEYIRWGSQFSRDILNDWGLKLDDRMFDYNEKFADLMEYSDYANPTRMINKYKNLAQTGQI
jgi:hypothetical protein